MTRKDYVLLAKAISDTQARIRTSKFGPVERNGKAYPVDQDEQLRGVRRAAAYICDALSADNPRFDPTMFLKACGYGATSQREEPAIGVLQQR